MSLLGGKKSFVIQYSYLLNQLPELVWKINLWLFTCIKNYLIISIFYHLSEWCLDIVSWIKSLWQWLSFLCSITNEQKLSSLQPHTFLHLLPHCFHKWLFVAFCSGSHKSAIRCWLGPAKAPLLSPHGYWKSFVATIELTSSFLKARRRISDLGDGLSLIFKECI